MAIFSFQVLLPFIQYVYIYFTKAILLVKYSSHFHFTFYPSLSLTATFLLIILFCYFAISHGGDSYN